MCFLLTEYLGLHFSRRSQISPTSTVAEATTSRELQELATGQHPRSRHLRLTFDPLRFRHFRRLGAGQRKGNLANSLSLLLASRFLLATISESTEHCLPCGLVPKSTGGRHLRMSITRTVSTMYTSSTSWMIASGSKPINANVIYT